MSTHNNTFLADVRKTSGASKKALNVGLWTAQLLLAAAFGMAGFWKTTTPIAELAQKLPWVVDAPNLVRFIGTAELLGAVGLILPALTRIKPLLTPLAAAGLFVIMVLAILFHVSRGDIAQAAPVTFVLGGLAAFVAWGRYKKAPIRAR